MNHLENSFKGKNKFWRYIVMLVVIFAAINSVGAIPFIIAGAFKQAANPDVLSTGGDFLSNLGINQNLMLAFMLFPFIVGLTAFALLIKPLHSKSFLQTITGRPKFKWSRFFISGAIWLILMAVYLFISIAFDRENFTLNNISSSLITLILLSLLLIPFQAAFEEVIFRGYFMQGFTCLFPVRLFALSATAMLFALMHSFNPEVKEFGFFSVMPQYFIFGLIFGIITILDNGIESALGAHAANNAFLCIMVTHKASALQTAAVFEQHNYCPETELAGLAIAGLIFIFALWKIFGWSDISILLKKVQAP